MPKQRTMSRDTRKVMARLTREGWTMRPGKGDHVNFSKPETRRIITIDTGKKQMPKPVFSKVAEAAGW